MPNYNFMEKTGVKDEELYSIKNIAPDKHSSLKKKYKTTLSERSISAE